MTQDDRDYYRMLSDKHLLMHHDEFGPSAELAVVLAERLAALLDETRD